jgi:hypothetical protein
VQLLLGGNINNSDEEGNSGTDNTHDDHEDGSGVVIFGSSLLDDELEHDGEEEHASVLNGGGDTICGSKVLLINGEGDAWPEHWGINRVEHTKDSHVGEDVQLIKRGTTVVIGGDKEEEMEYNGKCTTEGHDDTSLTKLINGESKYGCEKASKLDGRAEVGASITLTIPESRTQVILGNVGELEVGIVDKETVDGDQPEDER